MNIEHGIHLNSADKKARDEELEGADLLTFRTLSLQEPFYSVDGEEFENAGDAFERNLEIFGLKRNTKEVIYN